MRVYEKYLDLGKLLGEEHPPRKVHVDAYVEFRGERYVWTHHIITDGKGNETYTTGLESCDLIDERERFLSVLAQRRREDGSTK